ncbi:MAG: alpha/beta fold hydrolase, partial [Solirubrobacteraceae bacterium]
AGVAAALGAPAAASASLPVTKVLNGGTLHWAGTLNGSTDIEDGQGTSERGQGSLSWDTFYPVSSPYDGDPSPGPGYDDTPYTYLSGDVGTASSTSTVRSWDSGTSKYVTKTWTCKSILRSTDAPIRVGTPLDVRPFGYIYSPAGTGDFTEKGTCSDPNHAESAFFGLLDLTHAAQQDYAFPATPQLGGPVSKTVNATDKIECGSDCTGSYDGGGRFTLDCLLCVDSISLEETSVKYGARVAVPDGGTTDGNVVYLRAGIRNTSTKAYTSGVTIKDGSTGKVVYASDYRLPVRDLTWAPGQVRYVEWPINTEGMAWKNGQPNPDHTLQVLTAFGGGQVPFRVLPKPMILVHGWNSDASTWNTIKPLIAGLLNTGRVYAVGDGQVPGKMDTNPLTGDSIDANAKQEAVYVQAVREKLNAAHVDLVVHSMGGLISREYVQEHMPDPLTVEAAPPVPYPVVAHLVMLGTPNEGSACADVILPQSPGIPTLQLTRFHEKLFNRQVTNRRGVAMSVIAGEAGVPTCIDPELGDGVVAKSSAWSTFTDVSTIPDHHLAEPQDQRIFSGWVLSHVSRSSTLQSLTTSKDEATGSGSDGIATRGRAATRDAVQSAPDPVIVLSKAIDVPAGGSVDVSLASPTPGEPMVVAMLAEPGVGSALIAPNGSTASSAAAGSDDAKQAIRVH